MLEIVHEPLGIEDPYRTEPAERHPREPREHETVTVEIVTRPIAAATNVQVHIGVAGGASQIVAAYHGTAGDYGDRWIAELGAFAAGDVVTYTAGAQSANGERSVTGEFTFTVTRWHNLTRVTGWHDSDTAAWIDLTDESGGDESCLAFSFAAPDQLLIHVWPRVGMPGRSVQGAVLLAVREEEELLQITSGDTEIVVTRTSGAFEVRRHAQTVMRSAPRSPLAAWLGAGSTPFAVRLNIALEDGEALYGTGERFDQLDRRGTTCDLRVYEQYKNQGARTYLPVPILLSSRGHALAVDGTRGMTIDAGVTDSEILRIDASVARSAEACLVARLLLTPTPLDGLHAYLQASGFPVQPPDWAFGLWMSANDWNNQARVLSEVDRGDAEGIPGDVVVIEAWADEATFYIWNDAEYNLLPPDRPPRMADFRFPPNGRWPNPKALVDTLHERGKRLVLWQIPLLKQMDEPHEQNAADAETLIANGWCAHNPDGAVYRNPGWWFPGALLPDFTSDAAVQWWLSRRRYLVEELGIDGFKTDGGEHIWGSNVVFADGRRGDELINAFPVLYAGAYHRLLAECGRRDGLTFSRSGFAGSQRYPAHWAGDEDSTWEAFRHSIIAGLSAGASGIPFWGWDIAGFSGDIPSGELYRRAWMMSAFCPIMQYHSEHNGNRVPSRDRTPWNIAERTGDPDVLPVCREYALVRRQLQPYILREAAHTARTGRPLMCALPLAFPGDVACRAYAYEYMFGRDLLVAPTVEEGITLQEVYLPAGTWRDLWSEEQFSGPCLVRRPVPARAIPVFVCAGAPSPFRPVDLLAVSSARSLS